MTNTKPYRDPEVLEARYRKANGTESAQDLADAFDVSEPTVYYWLDKHDIGDTGYNAKATVNVSLETKARLDAAQRDDETLEDTIIRALDRLEAIDPVRDHGNMEGEV